jgi:hypothetical protein
MVTLARARRVTRARALAGALAGASALAQAAPASAPAAAFQAPGCRGAQDTAVSRLVARVRREHLYASWSPPGCLQYIVDRCTSAGVEVSLHEKHDERCGGDPATAPRVDSFRVHRDGRHIDWYDVVDDRWRPFDRIHPEGHR